MCIRDRGNGELDGGAGLRARRKGQLLIDHGENAAVCGIDDDGSAVHAAEGFDGSLTDDGVFSGGDVARANIAGEERVGSEVLVVVMD